MQSTVSRFAGRAPTSARHTPYGLPLRGSSNNQPVTVTTSLPFVDPADRLPQSPVLLPQPRNFALVTQERAQLICQLLLLLLLLLPHRGLG